MQIQEPRRQRDFKSNASISKQTGLAFRLAQSIDAVKYLVFFVFGDCQDVLSVV